MKSNDEIREAFDRIAHGRADPVAESIVWQAIDELERHRSADRTRDAEIADWLDAHAAGRKVDFYAPSKSGTAALQNAAAALRR